MFLFLMLNGKKLTKSLNNGDLATNFIKRILNPNLTLVPFSTTLTCDKTKENYINWVNKNVGHCNSF